MKLRFKPSQWVLLVSMLFMTLISINMKWNGEDWRTIVSSDGKGHYTYLPALFIYNDANLGFFQETEGEKYYNANTFTDYRAFGEGKVISKYYCGTAVAQVPFFLIGHAIAKGSSWDADGYSKPYMIMLSVAALFYLFLGMFFLQKLLRKFDVGDSSIAWITVATIFGTNLFYYTVVEAVTSHIYSFAFISMLFYFVRRWSQLPKTKYLLWIAFLLGLIIIIRPINVLVILAFPFIAGSWKNVKESLEAILQKKWFALLALVIGCSLVFIQLLYYKVATDHWIVYSYQEEGFDFTNPHFFDMLFSYRKGLFLYTPMYLLSLLGIIVLWKKQDRFRVVAWVFFFTFLTYVFSSWWMWFYGGSFSSRVYVEYLPFFMLLLGLSFNHWKRHWKGWALRSVAVLLVIICQIQTYQYRYGVIHYSDTTMEQYWNNFLRIDKLIQ
jgi:hypothetical protein